MTRANRLPSLANQEEIDRQERRRLRLEAETRAARTVLWCSVLLGQFALILAVAAQHPEFPLP